MSIDWINDTHLFSSWDFESKKANTQFLESFLNRIVIGTYFHVREVRLDLGITIWIGQM